MKVPAVYNKANRRQVLRALGVSAVSLSSAPALVGTTRASNGSNGKLIFIYDDGPVEDYTKTFPIHQEFGVPGCVAACPGLMVESPRWLTRDQLMEMALDGWEVMSHTIIHRALGEIRILSDIDAGDTEIHAQSNLQGRFAGDPLVIFNDETTTTVTAAGTDVDGDKELILLEDPIDTDFESGNGFTTWVRYTDEFTRYVLEESKEMLEAWGFPVTAYVHPYGRYDGYVSEVVPEYYEAVPNAGRASPFNFTAIPEPFNIGRRSFEENRMSIDQMAEFLDTIVEEPVFGVLYGHSDFDSLTEERIRVAIEMSIERDIEIVTLQEALFEYGVLDSVPTPVPPTPEPTPTENETPPETPSPTESSGATPTPTEENGNPSDAMPGFSIGAAAVGVGSVAAYLLYRKQNDTK